MYDIVNEGMSNAGHHYCVEHWALTSPLRLNVQWVLFRYSNLQGASPFNVSRGSTHLISPHHILLRVTVAYLSCSSCFRFMWNLWHLVWASPFSSFIQWTESLGILSYNKGPTSCSKGCTTEDFEPSSFGWVQLRSTQKCRTPTIGCCIYWYNYIVWTTLLSTSHVYISWTINNGHLSPEWKFEQVILIDNLECCRFTYKVWNLFVLTNMFIYLFTYVELSS